MPDKKQSLSITHPELATQADGWDPRVITHGSDKKLTWRCFQNHVWDATVSSRVAGRGCPFCSGRIADKGVNDLATLFPNLAQEAHGWDPTEITAKSSRKLPWVCKAGHKWEAVVKSRSVIGASCPYCDGRRATTGVSDLATLFPSIASQAFGWDPTVVNPHSHKKMEFICSEGHVVLQGVRRRVESTGCPVCQNDRVLVGFNDLATTHPEIAAEAVGWDPTTITAGSSKKLLWECKFGHQWKTGLANRAQKNGTGCPSCSGRIPIPGETDLATTHPDLALQAAGWDPTKVKAGTNKKLNWRCTKGHEWLSEPSTRSALGTGCPYCSGSRVIVGETDLATTHPEIAAEAVGWDPTTVAAGNDLKRRWKCGKNHEWDAPTYSRVGGGTGCPFCSNRTVLFGYNDLATTHPEIAIQADGWDPTTVTVGSGRKRKWRCSEGHSWNAVVASRSGGPKGGSGCPSCATSGFNPSLPGWLYFLDHDGWGLFQIGITNDPTRRISKHGSGGWTSIEIRGPMDGSLAKDLETSILKSLRKRGAQMAHRTDIRQFDGWTEAWTKDSLSVVGFKQLLEWVYEDDLFEDGR